MHTVQFRTTLYEWLSNFSTFLKKGWGNHNDILQFSFHEIYCERLYHQVAGTWDRHHDGLCDFPTSFCSGHGIILRGAANTSKGVMKNEHLTLPPSWAFMGDITILVPSQIAANGLLQRYYNLFPWARIKPKLKKSRSLSLVGGFAWEIRLNIGGDKIPTVRE